MLIQKCSVDSTSERKKCANLLLPQVVNQGGKIGLVHGSPKSGGNRLNHPDIRTRYKVKTPEPQTCIHIMITTLPRNRNLKVQIMFFVRCSNASMPKTQQHIVLARTSGLAGPKRGTIVLTSVQELDILENNKRVGLRKLEFSNKNNQQNSSESAPPYANSRIKVRRANIHIQTHT